ncbi:ABC transporter permease [Flammeovirga kamogawensis]|uniref:FtsX-like permease family protein n=1 Tax=Flammeovirga kamogawensis TaxID=373891 RepID=A0ABX8GX83_9BACT|nr:FtsX-like permease family protein [Flammeovirga kamogawensis]MBB6460869.1 putative ABC transport system permease protein [Flammeovirga kamogawensis]QWG08215.1 FtsX-like permease family protein [Flammeovirga kamogawensis]TRX70018.1 FtsX-like permease family protein [Flammeovirga kamogawensis]
MRFQFILKHSVRDLKKSISKIIPFILSIVVGVASLVAMTTFSENVNQDLNKQAKELLGADLELRSSHELQDSVLNLFSHQQSKLVKQFNFASMAFSKSTEKSRLVDLRALELGFPYYGQLEVYPKPSWSKWKNQEKVVFVDSVVLYQLEAAIGDSLRFGAANFEIAGTIKKGIGQSAVMAATVPIVYFPFKYLEDTKLIQKGSRVNYRYFYAFNDTLNVQNLVDKNQEIIDEKGIRVATIENNTARIGRFFNDIDAFLKLITFISLLLGCIGVSSGIFIYIKGKLKSVAIYRCLGATTNETFLIYFLQVLFLGLVGGVIGAFIGAFAQLVFPLLFSDLLMVSISNNFSVTAIVFGIFLSLFVSVLFGWYPLLQVLGVSPIYVLRSISSLDIKSNKLIKALLIISVSLFVILFSYWLLGDFKKSLFFFLSIFCVIIVLTLLALLLIKVVKTIDLSGYSFSLKYGVSQLFRPNNQTLLLGVTIGLGVFLIICLVSIRSILIEKVTDVGGEGDANLVLYDVQKSQVSSLKNLLEKENIQIEQNAPIVTMSLKTVNGKTKKQAMLDSTIQLKRYVFDREYRVTYRSSLKENEKTIEGEWQGNSSINEMIPISVSDNYLKSSGLAFGDTVIFNVQGFNLTTKITHVRAVDFARMEANFVVLFPAGVLEAAPSFHVLAIKVRGKDNIASIQSKVVAKYPNVSSIDLGLIFESLNDILDQVSFVFKWLGGICIFTGFLVLWSSMSIGKFQRKKEAGVLRALGAKRKHLVRITFIEYFSIGTLSTLTGLLLGWLGSWALAYFVFDIPFFIAIKESFVLSIIIIGMTVSIGVLFMRSLSKVPAITVLKEE